MTYGEILWGAFCISLLAIFVKNHETRIEFLERLLKVRDE